MSYPGGKGSAGVAQAIINQQPPHTMYIEPFLGHGAVMRLKRPALSNLGFDLDLAALAKFNGSVGLGIYRYCGLAFLESYVRCGGEETTLIYCDPPYPMETRASARNLYRFEFSDADHRRFLDAALSLRCMAQVSSYWNPMYAEALSGWRLITFNAMTRGGVREECLWMNYPEPAALHDYRFLGANFRERDRVKRKAQRWRSRIAALPRLERVALFSALSSTALSDDAHRRPSHSLAMQDLLAANGDDAGTSDIADAAEPRSYGRNHVQAD